MHRPVVRQGNRCGHLCAVRQAQLALETFRSRDNWLMIFIDRPVAAVEARGAHPQRDLWDRRDGCPIRGTPAPTVPWTGPPFS